MMSVEGAFITDVEVTNCLKKQHNYVYAISTTWSDGSRFELYRKYSHFFAFQNTLLALFPKEAGKFDPSQRTIPYLPTIDYVLKIFGRTSSKSVMKSRLHTIDHYCKIILLNIGTHIAHSPHVLNFFRPTLNDRQERRLGRLLSFHPMQVPTGIMLEECVLLADFTPDNSKSQKISAKAGEAVTVLKTDESGWSLCSKLDNEVGWIPSSYLAKKSEEIEMGNLIINESNHNAATHNDDEEIVQKYKAICEYDSEGDESQVSFPEGAVITVIDRDEDGWWFVEYNGKEGWAPYSYLEPLNKSLSNSRLSVSDDLDIVLSQKKTFDDPDLKVYNAKRGYESSIEDELSFPKNATIKILNKSTSGWWTGMYNDKVGLVPATYLAKQNLSSPETDVINEQFKRVGSSNFHIPPPRRNTVRQTVKKFKTTLAEETINAHTNS